MRGVLNGPGFMFLTQILAISAAILLVYAAFHDIAARTVPNWLPLALIGVGLALRLIDHHLLSAVIIGAVTFVVLFCLWLLGAMGGGDVKLWAATVLLIPPGLQPDVNFFLSVALLGGGLAIAYYALFWVFRSRRGSARGAARGVPAVSGLAAAPGPTGLPARVLRAELWRIRRRAPLPYALAIAGGALITFLPISFQRLG